MGWFWGDSSKDGDPTKKLDPGLQQYLEKQAPSKYSPTSSVSDSQPSQSPPDAKPQPSTPTEGDTPPATEPTAPAESLFPDGRYAYLWKTYQSLENLEGPRVTPAEKVVDQFKKRKDVLNRAALENCADEHYDLTTCFQSGDLKNKVRARMTMCREENQKFSRCYTMQAVRTTYQQSVFPSDLIIVATMNFVTD